MSQERTLTMNNSKTCSKCQQVKSLDFFYRSKGYIYSACKACHSKQSMEWQQKNKDAFRAYKKQWQRTNSTKIYEYVTKYRSDKTAQVKEWRSDWEKRNSHKSREYRVRKKNLKSRLDTTLITDKDIRKLLQQPCLYCGAKAEHVDHVFPLSRGGAHTLGNLAPACSKCNLSKATKTIMEWRIWKIRVGLGHEE